MEAHRDAYTFSEVNYAICTNYQISYRCMLILYVLGTYTIPIYIHSSLHDMSMCLCMVMGGECDRVDGILEVNVRSCSLCETFLIFTHY